jgi:hypothetical protein
MAGTRIWQTSAGGPPCRSGYVPLCVPEGQLVSSGQMVRPEALHDPKLADDEGDGTGST